MCTISFALWIVDAAARFSSRHGAVSQQAKQSKCSRQTIYDRARKVWRAVVSEFSGCPSRQQLRERIQSLSQQNAQLRKRLATTIEFPRSKQQEFSTKARAMGLSLNQIGALLVVILGPKSAPARSTIQPSS